MKTRPASLPALLAFVLVVSAAYLSGLASIPFHPDESTYIYTSADVEGFFRDPSSQFWKPENEGDPLQRYRELDAPLINYFIAGGRWFAGEMPLFTDWDWGKTWQANIQDGAMPSMHLLLASRASVAILLPLSLFFFFLTVYRISNEFTAWASVVLLASNALVLLHTRRAMAEGILLFTSILTLWSLVRIEKERWLISIPTTLAFCAKQLLAPLIPVGLAAVLWRVTGLHGSRWRPIMRQVLLFSMGVFILLAFFHPFLWGQPLQAFKAAIQARQELSAAQIADRPEQVLNTPARKLVSMISCLYLTSPIFAETGNYQSETHSAETAYLANPLHTLFRSIPAGGILLILTLFGFFSGLIQAVKRGAAAQRRLILILAASIAQTLALYLLVPLPWQRYYLPLVPYSCLWIAYGIDQLRQAIDRGITTRRVRKVVETNAA
ncbi:MAG: phospholipid carrier-dependent glycosyltransferase [Anaerolineaceae bacterium]|nr:phospholipid carrier-dependent glycosyltransferase [Anaerolineaceae bacterium]